MSILYNLAFIIYVNRLWFYYLLVHKCFSVFVNYFYLQGLSVAYQIKNRFAGVNNYRIIVAFPFSQNENEW